MALMEANIIDNCNADTWGYLCLLNMTLGRYDEFSQCYAEMIKVYFPSSYQINKKNLSKSVYFKYSVVVNNKKTKFY